MASELVVPISLHPLSNSIVQDIKDRRQSWQKPLTTWRLDVDLPVLRHSEKSPLPCRETIDEFENVISEFSTQINNLFEALVVCHDLDVEAVQETTPYFSDNGLFLTISVQKQLLDHPLKCHHRTYHSNRLLLENFNRLPQVLCVTKLRILSKPNHKAGDNFANVRPVSLRVPLELLIHLPSIRELECPWGWEHLPIAYPSEPMRHYSRPWEGPWRDSRHDFGRAVQELNEKVPVSLTRARFWFYPPGTEQEDQSVPMPNLVHPASIDPVSAGLCQLASHLEELDLRAILTPDIFDPRALSWPRMKRIRIEFHPMRSDGSWYFIGPQGEDPHPQGFHIQDETHYPPAVITGEDKRMDYKHTDYNEEWYDPHDRRPDMFRTEPCADRIEPLLANFAKRLRVTPSIEEAELFTHLSWFPSEERQARYEEEGDGEDREDEDDAEDAPLHEEGVHRWGVKYTAAKDESKAAVEWQVGDWRPSSNIIELFETLGDDGGVEMSWNAFEFTEMMEQDPATAFV